MLKPAKGIKVLIADQSSHTRLVLESILSEEEEICVSGLAADGDELLKCLKKQEPHVILVNYDLPKNNRLFTFKRIFSEAPTPIILMVKREQLTLELIQETTALGVFAIVLKPEHKKYPDFRTIAPELIHKVKAVKDTINWDVQQMLDHLTQQVETEKAKPRVVKPLVEKIIVIGASTGGTQAIEHIVKELSDDLLATILVAVHLPAGFTKSLTERLQGHTKLTVTEGRQGMLLKPNKVIVAPGGRNMVIQPIIGNTKNYKISFTDELANSYDRPSVDLLMQSVANSNIQQVLGIILTGMGKDGTIGATTIHKRGGMVVAQDEASSAIFGMAKSVIDSGISHHVLPLSEIPHFINSYVAGINTVGVADDTL
ncbi:response regulator [Pontibacter sp. BT310]|jgi:two-component system, chemotaxis family, protein-glutamate methylesterase/glutaminase|uniref:protein-glutamate methylesterase n=1 Tax=Pontibacter populi TaxID=890055 RepID=A0ABS6XH75_9BACT|nr:MULTISPECIES: chemotaxis protein CheB [Pontibacter]MBJ6119692.1 response regulator [Pontibacter sp. BT310]MBW3366545.1 response regulator [Pontibacter populi]